MLSQIKSLTSGEHVCVGSSAGNLVRKHLRGPHASRILVDVDLVRLTRIDAEHVGDKDECGVLRGELLAEDPKVLKLRVVPQEVRLHD